MSIVGKDMDFGRIKLGKSSPANHDHFGQFNASFIYQPSMEPSQGQHHPTATLQHKQCFLIVPNLSNAIMRY
jgi:hypothetical protein